MIKTLAIGAAIVGLCAPATAQMMMPNTAMTGKDFAMTAASADRYERESAQIAEQKGADPRVRSLAQMLDAAHTQSTKDLGMAAEEAGIGRLDGKLSPGQERMLDALRKSDPTDFDKLYLQQQAQVHTDAQGLMMTYAKIGAEAPLRAAAAKTAPMVTQHLAEVTRLQNAM